MPVHGYMVKECNEKSVKAFFAYEYSFYLCARLMQEQIHLIQTNGN